MEIKIALAGNPNSGKTTLFNALTGSNQFVGNWPGVTVEKKEGKLKKHDDVTITDLPGIYSLSPYTLEEVVARNYLIGERPDAILLLHGHARPVAHILAGAGQVIEQRRLSAVGIPRKCDLHLRLLSTND